VSLARSATLGAVWTIGLSVGSRLIGVVGTLILTRYISPQVYGEVNVAVVLVLTVNALTRLGLINYMPAHPHAGREATFHASLFHMVLGFVGLAVILLMREPLGPLLNSPGMSYFMPGVVLAGLLGRFSAVPSAMLARDMRFATLGAARGIGELTYTLVAVLLAMAGWGGNAIVVGNIARSAIQLVIMSAATGLSEWIRPCRLTLETTRRLFAFGIPLWIAGLAAEASRRWDNLLVARFLGPKVLGTYNLAYNLADIPASHVGEHIGDVLLPTFARMDAARRRAAFVRACGLLSLVVFPLGVGLGAIAQTLAHTIFDPRWWVMAPMLSILSALSVARPVGWLTTSYLQACDRTRVAMNLEIFKVVVLLTAITALAQVGPLWVCAAAGIAFGAHSLAGMGYLSRLDGIPISSIVVQVARPLAACVPLVGAVLGLRYLLDGFGIGHGVVSLALEIIAGGLVYVAFAFVLAPGIARDFLGLVFRALHREKDDEDEEPSEEE